MKLSKSNWKKRRFLWRHRIAVVAALVMVLLFSGTALAAQVTSGDTYILPRGEVVNDDLYVSGGQVTIDGTVEGDLVVAGGYIEINGVVNGDVLAAGGAVVIAGTVQDDVRAAGGAVILNGSVGGDFFAAAGGGWPGMVTAFPMPPFRVEGHNVPQGLQMNAGSTVGGDAYLFGGQGLVAGSIGKNLVARMGNLTFNGHVAGDATLTAQSLQVGDQAQVQGQLNYSTASNITIPATVAASVHAQPWNETPAAQQRNPVFGFFGWLLRTALILVGYLLVAWLVWTFAPHQIANSVAVMEARPMETGAIGLVVAVLMAPLMAVAVFIGVLFWGWFPGGLFVGAFVFGLVALVWLLSPVYTGLWLGRKLGAMVKSPDGDLPHLLLGTAVIVMACRFLTVIPCLGDLLFQLIFLVSFALTVGSWMLRVRRPPHETALASATPAVS